MKSVSALLSGFCSFPYIKQNVFIIMSHETEFLFRRWGDHEAVYNRDFTFEVLRYKIVL